MALDVAAETVKLYFPRIAEIPTHSNSADEADMRNRQHLALEISSRSVQRSR